jgi:hypothetical protein
LVDFDEGRQRNLVPGGDAAQRVASPHHVGRTRMT